MQFRASKTWLLLLCFLLCGKSYAAGLHGKMPIKRLGQYLVVPVTFHVGGSAKQSHALLDLDRDTYLSVHSNAVGSFQRLLGSDEPLRVELPVGSFDVDMDDRRKFEVVGAFTTPLDDVTRKYDVELGNIDVIGILGYRFFRDYAVHLDVAAGFMELLPAGSAKSQLTGQKLLFASHDLVGKGQAAYVPLLADGQSKGLLRLSTAGYHSALFAAEDGTGLAPESLRIGDGRNQAPLSQLVAVRQLATADLKKFAYLQVKPSVPAPADARVLGVLGLSLWQQGAMWLDVADNLLAMTSSQPIKPDTTDLAFYQASQQQSWPALQAFLQAYPQSLHTLEVVDELFYLGLAQRQAAPDYIPVFRQGMVLLKPREKLDYMLTYCQTADALTPQELWHTTVIAICEEGLNYVAYSQAPARRQLFQLVLGERYLAIRQAKTAWKYYMSASFASAPNLDEPTKVGLARSYAALGRYQRATAILERVASTMSSDSRQQYKVDVLLSQWRTQLAETETKVLQ